MCRKPAWQQPTHMQQHLTLAATIKASTHACMHALSACQRISRQHPSQIQSSHTKPSNMCQSSSCKSEVTSSQNKEQSIQRQGNCARCLMYRHTSPINRQAAGTLLPPRLPERLSAATSHRISHSMHCCPDERIAQRHSTHHPPITLSLSPSTPARRDQTARGQHTALAGGHSKPSPPLH
jgi:hypothetical protein